MGLVEHFADTTHENHETGMFNMMCTDRPVPKDYLGICSGCFFFFFTAKAAPLLHLVGGAVNSVNHEIVEQKTLFA